MQAQSAWRTITSGMSSLWSSVQSGLSSMFSYVSSGISRLMSQASSGMSSAWERAKSLGQGVLDAGKSLYNGMKQVGSYAMQGLKNGVTGLRNGIVGLGRTVGGWLTGGTTSDLRIGSPSKVFAEIGKFVDLGLIQGIEDYEKNVLSSVSEMASNVSDEVDTSDATFRIGAESNDLVSNLTNVTTHLSKIAGIFSEINKTLSGMGGMIAPAISTGSVVPYATKVSPTPKTTGTDLSGLSDGIDSSERMYDMVSLLRRILEVLERNGTLDKDDLAAALAFAMRGESRGFGV